ncbi:hypothetical protein CR513_41455, partial [Mucuna pruriens]
MTYKHSIPSLDDLLDEFHGSQMFSKIDLKNTYHQIRVREGINGKQLLRQNLGFVNVGSNRVKVDNEKVKAIQEWAMPKTIQEEGGLARGIRSPKANQPRFQNWARIYKERPNGVGVEAKTSHGLLTLKMVE